jgi:2-aminoadipate transaminase
MNYIFADRMQGMESSAIRELLKVAQDPEVIAFSAGNPAPESFPIKEMADISASIFQEQGAKALQYGISEGYPELRRLSEERLKNRYGIGRDFDQLIIVSGGQQGMELSTKILTNEGDTVICENPSFIGSMNAFRSYGLKLRGVEMDEEGILPEALEAIAASDPKVRFLYTIPTFQNPSGRTMTLERRKAVLEIAKKYDFLIVEDNPYGDLRYEGEDVAPIKSLDEEGRVIYVGSYSKVLAPGIRMGFVSAHQDLIAKMVIAKQVSDVHTNQFFMILAAEYLKRYNLDDHVQEVRKLYKHKLDLMAGAIREHFPAEVIFHKPQGGLFLWCSLPEGYDALELCRRSGEAKVSIVPGRVFEIDAKPVSGTFRMNFSTPSEEAIQRGVKILGGVIRQYLDECRPL